ncbi:MAG: 23S rRNA (guanosine(2251)-2'-O)-methyltransferase RlmB [Bacilli bacterium]|nr:23S rRNA (guanosine(2251)-2'-O)-methyltransferase RlmB [Bacilli bacterium]
MLVWGKNVFNEIDLKKIRKVYLDKSSLKDYQDFLENNSIRYDIVEKRVLDDMAKKNHQGIVVDIYEYEYKNLDECLNDDFVVILDHLEDPHNFGAIIRTCECAGIKHIVIPKDRSVRVNETVIKVSSGAISYVDIIMVSNLTNAMNKLKDNGFFIYGADMDGTSYLDADFSGKKVLVIGNEGKGISQIVSQGCDEIISIPMEGNINSLNASVSAGILIYGMKRNDGK